MKRASFLILLILIGIVLNAQEKSRKRIPVSFNINLTLHYHIQQVYLEKAYNANWEIENTDVDEKIAYGLDLYDGYKIIHNPETSRVEMLEYSECEQGLKIEVDIQPYKFVTTGLGFQFSPHARDRYSYYLKLGVTLSTKGKKFFYSPHARIGGRKYQWEDFQQNRFFAGVGINLDILIVRNILLNISFSGDWYQNYENWGYTNYGPRPPEYYYTSSRNDNWIITGSLGIKYKISDK
jgi:hypothetical protein